MIKNKSKAKTIDLRTSDLRKVPVGTTVITSKGFKFKLVSRKKGKESWKDLTSKLTWHDAEDEKYRHYQAQEKFGNGFPTKEEFEVAESHGFREVVPNMANKWFWSSSVDPYSTYYAFGFGGDDGDIYYDFRFFNYSVRCVLR